MTNKILLVEDEIDVGEVINLQLMSLGYDTEWVKNGAEALRLIQSGKMNFDLFLLDRMLPEVNGLEICRFIRMFEQTKATPILFVTAQTSNEDIVEGLEAGADDYLTKPFDMNIMVARIKALLRRSSRVIQANTQEKDYVALGPIKIYPDQYQVYIDDKEVELTRSEFKLMAALVESQGKVLTRKKLVELIQDGPVHVTDRTIDTHIFGLRKKLGHASDFIETIRGVGYRIANNDS